MTVETVILSDMDQRRLAFAKIKQAPDGHICRIGPPIRSLPQNSLQHKWYAEVAAQAKDRTPQDAKRYAKLHFGVPILRAEDDSFSAAYDEAIKPLDYETKLLAMDILPVTSRLDEVQMQRFMSHVHNHFTQEGFVLTLPEDRT